MRSMAMTKSKSTNTVDQCTIGTQTEENPSIEMDDHVDDRQKRKLDLIQSFEKQAKRQRLLNNIKKVEGQIASLNSSILRSSEIILNVETNIKNGVYKVKGHDIYNMEKSIKMRDLDIDKLIEYQEELNYLKSDQEIMDQ